MAKGPYSRVYHSIVDDPMFAGIFDDNDALATWLRMLLIADAMYPSSAQLPRRNRSLRLLMDAGLVEEVAGNRYLIRGLRAERERRSHIASNASASRWGMPRREENRKEEKVALLHDGRHGPSCSVCTPLLGVKLT